VRACCPVSGDGQRGAGPLPVDVGELLTVERLVGLRGRAADVGGLLEQVGKVLADARARARADERLLAALKAPRRMLDERLVPARRVAEEPPLPLEIPGARAAALHSMRTGARPA